VTALRLCRLKGKEIKVRKGQRRGREGVKGTLKVIRYCKPKKGKEIKVRKGQRKGGRESTLKVIRYCKPEKGKEIKVRKEQRRGRGREMYTRGNPLL
jgi:hypothetical protein